MSEKVPLGGLSRGKGYTKKACLACAPWKWKCYLNSVVWLWGADHREAFPVPCLSGISSPCSNSYSPGVSLTNFHPATPYTAVVFGLYMIQGFLLVLHLSPISCFLKGALSAYRIYTLTSRMLLFCNTFISPTIITCMPLLSHYWTKQLIRI